MKRLLPPLLLILTWAAMILFAVAWPLGEPFHVTLRIAGGVLAALGLLLSVRGARTFRQAGTNIMTFEKPDKFVKSGLFAWSRNPMYLGFALCALCALGGAVALGAASALVIVILFGVTLDRWYVRFEEIMMREAFGAKYDAYCRKVRRWL